MMHNESDKFKAAMVSLASDAERNAFKVAYVKSSGDFYWEHLMHRDRNRFKSQATRDAFDAGRFLALKEKYSM